MRDRKSRVAGKSRVQTPVDERKEDPLLDLELIGTTIALPLLVQSDGMVTEETVASTKRVPLHATYESLAFHNKKPMPYANYRNMDDVLQQIERDIILDIAMDLETMDDKLNLFGDDTETQDGIEEKVTVKVVGRLDTKPPAKTSGTLHRRTSPLIPDHLNPLNNIPLVMIRHHSDDLPTAMIYLPTRDICAPVTKKQSRLPSYFTVVEQPKRSTCQSISAPRHVQKCAAEAECVAVKAATRPCAADAECVTVKTATRPCAAGAEYVAVKAATRPCAADAEYVAVKAATRPCALATPAASYCSNLEQVKKYVCPSTSVSTAGSGSIRRLCTPRLSREPIPCVFRDAITVKSPLVLPQPQRATFQLSCSSSCVSVKEMPPKATPTVQRPCAESIVSVVPSDKQRLACEIACDKSSTTRSNVEEAALSNPIKSPSYEPPRHVRVCDATTCAARAATKSRAVACEPPPPPCFQASFSFPMFTPCASKCADSKRSIQPFVVAPPPPPPPPPSPPPPPERATCNADQQYSPLNFSAIRSHDLDQSMRINNAWPNECHYPFPRMDSSQQKNTTVDATCSPVDSRREVPDIKKKIIIRSGSANTRRIKKPSINTSTSLGGVPKGKPQCTRGMQSTLAKELPPEVSQKLTHKLKPKLKDAAVCIKSEKATKSTIADLETRPCIKRKKENYYNSVEVETNAATSKCAQSNLLVKFEGLPNEPNTKSKLQEVVIYVEPEKLSKCIMKDLEARCSKKMKPTMEDSSLKTCPNVNPQKKSSIITKEKTAKLLKEDKSVLRDLSNDSHVIRKVDKITKNLKQKSDSKSNKSTEIFIPLTKIPPEVTKKLMCKLKPKNGGELVLCMNPGNISKSVLEDLEKRCIKITNQNDPEKKTKPACTSVQPNQALKNKVEGKSCREKTTKVTRFDKEVAKTGEGIIKRAENKKCVDVKMIIGQKDYKKLSTALDSFMSAITDSKFDDW